MGRILFRYVSREVVPPFLIGLLIFTVLLFTIRILKLVDLVVNRGVPVAQLLETFAYILPAFFEITVPMAFLLALLWGLGRLSADREIIAFKSCGIGLLQLAAPVWTFAFILLCTTFVLTLYVRPWSNAALKQALYGIAKNHVSAGLKEKTFNTDFAGLVIYAEEIQPPGTRLHGVMIADNRHAQHQNTIFAERGTILAGEDQEILTLRLLDGSIHSFEQLSHTYHTTHFSVYDVSLNLSAILANVKEPVWKPKEMTLGQLLDTLARSEAQTQQERNASIELHRRLSLPFACVVFSFLALPLSLRFRGTQHSHGFALTMGVLLSYYLLLTVGEALGKKAVLPPGIALWLPNIILGIVGVYLFERTRQEKPFFTRPVWKRRSTPKQAWLPAVRP